jgi:hypothetical protein
MRYQPFIIEEAERIVELLDSTGFFEEFQIENKDFTIEYFCDKLTKKFVEGKLDEDGSPFTIDEMDKILNEIVIGTTLHDLQKSGIIDSIEDENNEERFFLTNKGKEIATKIKNNQE